MGRYPRNARNARLKCIDCNAPVVETTDDRFVCVDCGSSPISRSRSVPAGTAAD